MKLAKKLLILFVILAFSISACDNIKPESDIGLTLAALSVQSTVDRAVVLTSQASGGSGGDNSGGDTGSTDANPPADTAIAPIADTPLPTDTPQPLATPTLGVPMISVNIDTNCRIGPGQVYDLKGALLVGEQAEVVAWDGYGIYYYVVNPDGAGYCWLWAEYATITGNTQGLPVFTPPPSPTPTFTPTPELLWQGDWQMAVDGTTFSTFLTQSGNTVSGSFPVSGNTLTMTGTVSNDGKTVTGTFIISGGVGNGTFTWKLKNNHNQFVGNGVNGATTGEWCGYRPSSSQPNPCLGP